jgi:hypothetical protein
MRESTTYQRILQDGRNEEARRLVIRQGTKRLGTPDPTFVITIEGIQEIDILESLLDRTRDPNVRDWKTLLGSAWTHANEFMQGVDEGRLEGARRLLLCLGTKRFGTPDPSSATAMKAIKNVYRLEALCESILDANIQDWNTLLRSE